MVTRTLVVGYGHWGRVLTNNLLAHDRFFVAGIVDPDLRAREDAMRRNLYTFKTLTDALDQARAQLVIIAAPIGEMMPLAFQSLQRHAHVMLAKPGPRSMRDARRLYELASARGLVICVDYTMLSSFRFAELRQTYSDATEIRCVRDSDGTRSDAHIIDDMMIHDLALVSELNPDASWFVMSVETTDEHAARITLQSDDMRLATITADRHDGTMKRRTMRVAKAHELPVLWDQINDEEPYAPLEARLDSLAYQITSRGGGNWREMLRVTQLLENAHAALERDHRA